MAKQSYAEGDITIYPRLLNMATTLARSKPLWMAKIMALITQFNQYVAVTRSRFESADQPTKMELLWYWLNMYYMISRATLGRKERMMITGRGS